MKVRPVTVHITVQSQRVTMLEVRAPYVAAELRNPIVYAYMVNGPEAAPRRPRVQWRPRLYTAYFQLRCRQAVHWRVAKFRTATVGNYLKHFTLQSQL